MKKSFKIPIYNQYITVSSAMPDKYKNDYRAIFVYDEWTLYYQPEFWDVEYCVHECVHIVNKLCERLLINLDYTNDEAYAYLMEFIFKKVWKLTKPN